MKFVVPSRFSLHEVFWLSIGMLYNVHIWCFACNVVFLGYFDVASAPICLSLLLVLAGGNECIQCRNDTMNVDH